MRSSLTRGRTRTATATSSAAPPPSRPAAAQAGTGRRTDPPSSACDRAVARRSGSGRRPPTRSASSDPRGRRPAMSIRAPCTRDRILGVGSLRPRREAALGRGDPVVRRRPASARPCRATARIRRALRSGGIRRARRPPAARLGRLPAAAGRSDAGARRGRQTEMERHDAGDRRKVRPRGRRAGLDQAQRLGPPADPDEPVLPLADSRGCPGDLRSPGLVLRPEADSRSRDGGRLHVHPNGGQGHPLPHVSATNFPTGAQTDTRSYQIGTRPVAATRQR